MNKSLKYIAILSALPLLATGLFAGYATDAYAAKSEGTSLSKYGSNSGVCGIQLCSEYPGGYSAWIEDRNSMMLPGPEKPEMEKSTMDEPEMEKSTMDEPEMEKSTMDEHDMMHTDVELKLSRANVPATIPLNHGYYNGEDVFFIITDSSDKTHADVITESQGWKVELAPLLANTPASALSRTYMFTNGIEGSGVHGFQSEVFTSTPAQPETYSALTAHVHVTWTDGSTPMVLDSEEAIMAAEENGEIILTELPVVINMPHIVWPGGQMVVKEDQTVTDDTPYGGGQILEINTEEMYVTFVAHRGWGPDGRTIYYIVTDATPSGPAAMMGVVDAPTSANLISNSAAVDLFQFKNGLTGSGPLGFQPGIASGALGDQNYSPMWRIFLIEWNEPSEARLLENIDDIAAYREAGMITVDIAVVMDSDHIVNCPFIDPFQ